MIPLNIERASLSSQTASVTKPGLSKRLPRVHPLRVLDVVGGKDLGCLPCPLCGLQTRSPTCVYFLLESWRMGGKATVDKDRPNFTTVFRGVFSSENVKSFDLRFIKCLAGPHNLYKFRNQKPQAFYPAPKQPFVSIPGYFGEFMLTHCIYFLKIHTQISPVFA